MRKSDLDQRIRWRFENRTRCEKNKNSKLIEKQLLQQKKDQLQLKKEQLLQQYNDFDIRAQYSEMKQNWLQQQRQWQSFIQQYAWVVQLPDFPDEKATQVAFSASTYSNDAAIIKVQIIRPE